jgi:hypothetical protein
LGREVSPSGGTKSVCTMRTYISACHPNPAAPPNPNPIPHRAAYTVQRRITPSSSRRRWTPLWRGRATRRQRLSASCPLDASTSLNSCPLDLPLPCLPIPDSVTPAGLPVGQPLALLGSLPDRRPRSLACSAVSARPPQALGVDADRGTGALRS